MPDIVRTIQPFYETSEDFAVTSYIAGEVFGRARDIMSRYVGTVVMGEPLPMNAHDAGTTLNSGHIMKTSTLLFGHVPHIAFISGRKIDRNPTKPSEAVPSGRFEPKSYPWGLQSRVFVHVSEDMRNIDPRHRIAAAIATHEFAHSFGIGAHCESDGCIMVEKHSRTLEWAKQVLGGSVFCGDCTETLEAFRPEPPRTSPAAAPLPVQPFGVPRSVLQPWWLPRAS